jgi:hypothetical protein
MKVVTALREDEATYREMGAYQATAVPLVVVNPPIDANLNMKDIPIIAVRPYAWLKTIQSRSDRKRLWTQIQCTRSIVFPTLPLEWLAGQEIRRPIRIGAISRHVNRSLVQSSYSYRGQDGFHGPLKRAIARSR